MDTQLVRELPRERATTWRHLAVGLLGPLTMAGGVLWGLIQPYRITLLHPRGQGFWWLAVEPPLLVILVGIGFLVLVAPGLVEDLDAAEGGG